MRIQKVDNTTRMAARQLLFAHLNERQLLAFRREQPDRYDLLERTLASRQGVTMVAIQDGQVIGCLLAGPRAGQQRCAEVYDLRIRDDYSRHRVDVALLKELMVWARLSSYRQLCVEVDQKDKTTQRFYARERLKPSKVLLERSL